jgi:hypothetical protein
MLAQKCFDKILEKFLYVFYVSLDIFVIVLHIKKIKNNI